ncbi:hypothetical protein FD755_007147, partial [Muntiacus reevesi]
FFSILDIIKYLVPYLPNPGSNPRLPHCRQILYHLILKEGKKQALSCIVGKIFQVERLRKRNRHSVNPQENEMVGWHHGLNGHGFEQTLGDRGQGCLPSRFLSPWNSLGKNTGIGRHFLLQGIFPAQGLNPHLLVLGPLAGSHLGSVGVMASSFVTTHCALQFSSRGVRPGLTTVLARNLDRNTVGYLQWRWGVQSAMNTSIVRDTKISHFTVALQLGIPHSFALISYQHKFQDDDQTRVKGSLKAGFFGTVVEYGAERKISRHSVLGAAVSIGVPQGVSLKIKLNRASQTYFFPIHLTDQLLPSAVFYATVGPLVLYFALHRLVIKPYLRAQKEKELEKQRESTATDILQKKQEAEAAVRLMQESVRRIIEAEESRMGLIIVNAWYGKFVNDKSKKSEKVKVIDVTVPLQCLVKDSKLILTEASKAGLPGFYDPCVGEEKNLKVLYQFRGVLHQVMALDSEALRIPKQSHRIDTDG